jgi:hypothetical protein
MIYHWIQDHRFLREFCLGFLASYAWAIEGPFIVMCLAHSVILLVMLLFRMTQFVLLRITENPKGPIIGLSGLLIAIGMLVKAVWQ